MAEPLRITRSLDDITSRYTVFEPDQVLTHNQLNDLAGFLDDQDRLTRVALLGIGIVGGLRVSVRDEQVTVTKGVGVTTDGDLLRLPADARFDRFKPYDKTAPAYAPFYVDQDVAKDMLPVFELVRAGEPDDRATALGQLQAQSGAKLGDMAALLLMESCVKDDDLCSGTDCDNLGKGASHTAKLLLIRKSDLAALRTVPPTLDQAARSLPDVVAERPLLPGGLASTKALTDLYLATCGNIHNALVPALGALYPACESLLAELFATDPAREWVARLDAVRTELSRNPRGVQYYYDFLKDLAETYEAFRDLLFGDATLCCPDPGAFPKHLLLGGLDGGGSDLRTGFYPSPLTSRTADQQAHARFLAGKLDALIRTFKLPATVDKPRVTPSRFEDRSLEERAIPYYYEVTDALPIYRAWSYVVTQRGRETTHFSFNSDLYRPSAGRRAFVSIQTGRFDFYRIEGCLGQDVRRMIVFLQDEIRNQNLPFQVRAVALSQDRTKVAIKPPVRYTDLHRFHYLLRQDMVSQLDDTQRFSGSFKRNVDDAVARNVVVDQSEDTDGASVRTIAEQKHATVTSSSAAARTKLNKSYQDYVKDPSWRTDVATTVTAAGEFKANLGKVVKTEFATPFDTLIGTNHTLWLGWLDDMIKTKDEKEDDKLLFAKLQERHPGLEHFAGVTRGGTFVLVYDTDNNNVVVADFMLPYVCCDEVEEAPAEPQLPKPDVKPPFVLEQGVNVLPSREKFVKDKLTGFRNEIEPVWKKDIQIQRDYVDIFKDSVKVVGSVVSTPQKIDLGPVRGVKVTDLLLDFNLREMEVRAERVDFLRTESLKPNDPERQKTVEAQLRDAEVSLAVSAGDATQRIADSKMEVKEGTDGFKALSAVSDSLARVNHKDAIVQVEQGLKGARDKGSTDFKGVIGNILKNKGIRG